MDVSEKDAARSKWRLTQRRSRGRGKGRGSRGGGRAGRQTIQDVGSNEDRYYDDVEQGVTAAAEGTIGPTHRSQGADLSELLQQAEAFDPHFYYRSRVNLAEEFGVPPPAEGSSYQGLSIDLQGLAACLSLLPRSEVLDIGAFSEDDEDQEEEEEDHDYAEPGQSAQHPNPPASGFDRLDSTPPDSVKQKRDPPSVAGQQQVPATPAAAAQVRGRAAVSALKGESRGEGGGGAAAAAAAQGPARGKAVDSQSPDANEVDDLLSELVGTTQGAATAPPLQSQPQQRQHGVVATSRQTAQVANHAIASSSNSAVPAAVQLRHQPTANNSPAQPVQAPFSGKAAQAVQPAGAQAGAEEDELDFLLGLSSGRGESQQPKQQAGTMGTQQPAGSQHHASLEDWLDSL